MVFVALVYNYLFPPVSLHCGNNHNNENENSVRQMPLSHQNQNLILRGQQDWMMNGGTLGKTIQLSMKKE